MATATHVYTHITKHPGVCGGKTAIDQTRVRVNNVVAIIKAGRAPEYVLEQYPELRSPRCTPRSPTTTITARRSRPSWRRTAGCPR